MTGLLKTKREAYNGERVRKGEEGGGQRRRASVSDHVGDGTWTITLTCIMFLFSLICNVNMFCNVTMVSLLYFMFVYKVD